MSHSPHPPILHIYGSDDGQYPNRVLLGRFANELDFAKALAWYYSQAHEYVSPNFKLFLSGRKAMFCIGVRDICYPWCNPEIDNSVTWDLLDPIGTIRYYLDEDASV